MSMCEKDYLDASALQLCSDWTLEILWDCPSIETNIVYTRANRKAIQPVDSGY